MMKEAHDELNEAYKREQVICAPIVTDLGKLPKIFEICNKTHEINKHEVWDRKRFLFVALYLYYPRKLFGGKIPRGRLRKELCQILDINAISIISSNASGLYLIYCRYQTFRDDVTDMIQAVLDYLKD